MIRFILLAIFTIHLIFPAFAQEPSDSMKVVMAENAIMDAKNGVLVFRLPSDFKKIQFLEKKGVDTKEIIEEREASNKLYIQYMDYSFNFCKVLFTYDTTSRASLLQNDGRNCFLNENLEIDSDQSLEGRPFVQSYFGNTAAFGGSGVDAILFKNSDFKNLLPPFPFYVKINRFGYYFKLIFDKQNAEGYNIQSIAQSMNNKFNDYYEEVK
jgi:hypothetical protein